MHQAAAKPELAKWGLPLGMSVDRNMRALALGALLLSALAQGGCSSTSIADLPMIGTPADAPARPKEAGGYLPVHDVPPDREEAAIPPVERAKIEAELIAARDRQASVAAKNPATK
jgi:hypothetical protein